MRSEGGILSQSLIIFGGEKLTVIFAKGKTMNSDRYTKIILTIIAVALMGILFKPMVTPHIASADAVRSNYPFKNIQANQIMLTGHAAMGFFDISSGDYYIYDNQNLVKHFKVDALGKPLQRLR